MSAFPDLSTVHFYDEELAHLSALWDLGELSLVQAAHLLQQHSEGALTRRGATAALRLHQRAVADARAARTGAVAARLLDTEREQS